MLFGYIHGVHPFAEFTQAQLSFTTGDGVQTNMQVDIGHVFRDKDGQEHLVAGINFYYDSGRPENLSHMTDSIVQNGRYFHSSRLLLRTIGLT